MGPSKGATGPRNSYRVNGVAQCSLLELVPSANDEQSRFPSWTIPQAWGGHEPPKFLERKLEPGRTETAAIAPPAELTRRIGWAPHDFSHHRELNLTLIVARKFDQRIVIGSARS